MTELLKEIKRKVLAVALEHVCNTIVDVAFKGEQHELWTREEYAALNKAHHDLWKILLALDPQTPHTVIRTTTGSASDVS